MCLPNLIGKLHECRDLIYLFSTNYHLWQHYLNKSSDLCSMNGERLVICMSGNAYSNICSPQLSPASTRPFSYWPGKGLPSSLSYSVRMIKSQKCCLSEQLCLSKDPCANLFVILRHSQEKDCSNNSWTLHGASLSTSVMLWRGSGMLGPIQESCLLFLVLSLMRDTSLLELNCFVTGVLSLSHPFSPSHFLKGHKDYSHPPNTHFLLLPWS